MALSVSLWGLVGCQGPAGLSGFHYGEGEDCTMASGPTPVSLLDSLDPLREEFDHHGDLPRVVVLMPHMGCERGAAILREQVLDAYPDEELRLLVIWQDVARTQGAAAAARRATLLLDDPRVTAFHDCSGLAGRAFARGNLPVAEARELFLFYPAGTAWPSPSAPGFGDRRTARLLDEPLRPGQGAGEGPKPRIGTGLHGFNAAGAPAADVSRTQDGTRRKPVARRTSGVTDITPRTEDWVHRLGRVVPEKFCTRQELPGEIRSAVGRLVSLAAERRQRLARR